MVYRSNMVMTQVQASVTPQSQVAAERAPRVVEKAEKAESAARPLRADARRNREAILAAADELFRAEGMAFQMDQVAHRAGLGVGTVYRHFPTKDALLVELVVHRMDTLLEEAESAMAECDPAVAIRQFLHGAATFMGTDAGLRAAIGATADPASCAAYRQDLWDRKLALVTRAQEAGAVRDDLTVTDLDALMCGLGAAIDSGGDPRRMADVILDGMRVPRRC
jgi:AcrR family transcriptional regulator